MEAQKTAIRYDRHKLSRIISVREIVSADYFEGPHPFTFRHTHTEAWEICVCLQGEIRVFREGAEFRLSQNQLLFIQPELEHDVTCWDKSATAIIISFTCTNSNYLQLLHSNVLTISDEEIHLFRNIITELSLAYKYHSDNKTLLHLISFLPNEDAPIGAEHIICCNLEYILISLLRNATMQKGEIARTSQFKENTYAHLVNQVMDYIDKHIFDHLTVNTIADHFHYSRTRLTAICKSVTGYGINEMITLKRIRLAKNLLILGQKSIAEISEEVGFCSPQYFCRVFKSQVGIPPSMFIQSGSDCTPSADNRGFSDQNKG